MKQHTYTPAILLAAIRCASAHMAMQSPVPFAGTQMKDPLSAGAFPCHANPSTFDFSAAQPIKAGESTLFSFTNMAGPGSSAAVHGGGSCQFAIAKQGACTDPKDWKVLKTVIGGCPATAESNIQYKQCSGPDIDEKECVKSYNVPIPKELEDGNYVLAWTWFNRIGNREMYMQCAPATVSGGGGDAGYLDTLPSIFMANIKDCTECATLAPGSGEAGQWVLAIPNPGLNVDVSMQELDRASDIMLGECEKIYGNARSAPNFPKKGDNGGSIKWPAGYLFAGGKAPEQGAEGIGPVSSASEVPTPSSTSAEAPLATTTSPSSENLYTGMITATTYLTTCVTAPVVAAPSASSAIPSSASAETPSQPADTPQAAPPPSGNSGTCAAGQLPCSEDGELVCISATQFGLCDHGCMVPQDVAVGTVCKDGAIQHANAKRGKRVDAVRHVHAHVH